jgi:hypothetical protein
MENKKCVRPPFPFPDGSPVAVDDSPFLNLSSSYDERKATEAFVMTLMFMPGTANAIFVPVASVQWGWSADAVASSDNPFGFDFSASNPPTSSGTAVPVPVAATTKIFPQWTSNLAICQ